MNDAAEPGLEVPEVSAARERLAALADRPVHDHPAIFDDVQRLLTSALDPDSPQPPLQSGPPASGSTA